MRKFTVSISDEELAALRDYDAVVAQLAAAPCRRNREKAARHPGSLDGGPR